MRKAAILASVCIGVSASDVRAYDVAIRSRLTQNIEANDNFQMQPASVGWTYPSISTLVFDTIVRTPTMRFAATTDLSYRTYFGAGIESLTPGLDKGARADLEKKVDKLTTVTVGGSWRVQDAQSAQRAETGTSNASGDITTSEIHGSFQRQLTARDVITGSAQTTSREFSSPSGTPSTDLSTSASWIHQLSLTTKLMPSVQYQSISQQNASNTEITIWTGTVGLESQVTKRLTFNGRIGAVYLKLTQTGVSSSANPTNPVTPSTPLDLADPFVPFNPLSPGSTNSSGSGSGVDWLGNVLLSYKVNTTNTISLAAAQTVGPDTLGTIRKTQLVGAVWSHAINHWSNLTVAGDFSRQLSSSGTSDLYSAAVTYDRRLAREWNMALSYRFRQSVTEASSAHSNSILLMLTRDFTILPGATERGPGSIASDSTTALMASPAIWAMAQRSFGR